MALEDHFKVAGDVASVSVVSASLMDILPPVAAGLTIVWTLLRIAETAAARCLFRRLRRK